MPSFYIVGTSDGEGPTYLVGLYSGELRWTDDKSEALEFCSYKAAMLFMADIAPFTSNVAVTE